VNGRLAHPILSNYTKFKGKRECFVGKIGDVSRLEYNFVLVRRNSLQNLTGFISLLPISIGQTCQV
jgi:hypothetical protein